MANAKKCDRCGQFYDNYPIGNSVGIYNGIRRVRKDEFGSIMAERETIDLCEKCMSEFAEFLSNRKENK